MKTILLIEDNTSIEKTYVDIINSSEDFKIIENFLNCKSALKEMELLNPDIILFDIDAPDVHEIDSIRHIKNTFPEIKIMILTENQHHKFVFEALSSGVLGYLIKNNDLKIIKALEELEQGGSPMSNTISRMVVESFREHQFKELSKRENEILKLLAEGKSYSNIAKKLYVSLNTVKYHLRNIYEKLNIHCKDEAIKLVSSKKKYLKTA